MMMMLLLEVQEMVILELDALFYIRVVRLS